MPVVRKILGRKDDTYTDEIRHLRIVEYRENPVGR
jgi:hypothetical protein